MNKVFLSGNLTRDPEVRYSQSGKAFARMGIAINRRSKEKDSVDFFNIVAFDKTAEFCGRYLVKGSRVLVEGRLQTSSYEAQDGSKRTSTEIMVDNIEFAGARPGGSGDGGNYSGNRPADDYSSNRQTNDFYGDSGRNSAPSKKNDDYFGGGEPIDPDDTPF